MTTFDGYRFNEYQSEANKTAQYPLDRGLEYLALGLASEAGEVAGVVKKMIRDDGGALSRERTQKLIDELSDVLWYAAEIATLLDINLSSVARRNIEKLADRAERGVIKGSGDNR